MRFGWNAGGEVIGGGILGVVLLLLALVVWALWPLLDLRSR